MTAFPMYPYQENIVKKTVTHFLVDYINSIMIESATGSGKTRMGLEVAQAVHNEVEDLQIVWVAMRNFLLEQVQEEIAKFGITANITAVSMFDLDEAKKIRILHDEKPLMIILDEAHHDAAGSMTDLYQALEPDYILGLSATPYRADKAKLCFEKQITDAGIHRLIQDGYLSKFHMHIIEDWNIETVARHYLADPQKWGQSVFYWLTLAEAEAFNSILASHGIRTHFVQGSDDSETRKSQIQDFKEGKVQCLINCMVLTEGFDCPSLQTAWVRDSTKGPVMQMAGRAFRKFNGITKRIVQSEKTKWPISRTATPERQLVWKENRWLDAKPNHRLAEIAIEAIRRTVDNYQPLPDYMIKRIAPEKKKRFPTNNNN